MEKHIKLIQEDSTLKKKSTFCFVKLLVFHCESLLKKTVDFSFVRPNVTPVGMNMIKVLNLMIVLPSFHSQPLVIESTTAELRPKTTDNKLFIFSALKKKKMD